jgi:peptidoglycan/xylan/chitin deacetylase (PgdA/CDA1 family)
MSLLKSIFYTTTSWLPTALLKRLAPATTLLPYHHTVSDEPLLHLQHLYRFKNRNQFSDDLDFLLRHFNPISVADLIEAVHTRKQLPAKTFLLSFDDGFREVHDVIAPILRTKGVPAVFFINPAFIDNKALFYRCKISLLIETLRRADSGGSLLAAAASQLNCSDTRLTTICQQLRTITQEDAHILDALAQLAGLSFDDYLNRVQPFMTTAQLQTLHQQGFTIGGHSWDHPYYELLSEDMQVRQTMDSCRFVQSFVAGKPMVFSFPHTDKPIRQSFFEHPEIATLDLLFGVQNQKLELQNRLLHRFNAERPEYPLRKQINGLLLYLLLQQIMSRKLINREYA